MDNAAARQHVGLSAGNYVKLTVADTGPGVDPEIVNRIFDPYFTTWEIGQGTGMGLSVVQGIVKSHSGAVYIDNQSGSGAVFTVLLPLADRPPKAETKTETGRPADSASILFVDDEVSIAKMFDRMLTRLGYRVETRTNPVDALELFRAQPGRFDLIITDMTMPQMSGTEFSRRVMEIRPGYAHNHLHGLQQANRRPEGQRNGHCRLCHETGCHTRNRQNHPAGHRECRRLSARSGEIDSRFANYCRHNT